MIQGERGFEEEYGMEGGGEAATVLRLFWSVFMMTRRLRNRAGRLAAAIAQISSEICISDFAFCPNERTPAARRSIRGLPKVYSSGFRGDGRIPLKQAAAAAAAVVAPPPIKGA